MTMTPKITRRELLAASAAAAAAAALAGCNREQPLVPSRVSIVRAPAYDQRVYETVRLLLEEHRVDVRGRDVVVKPNLVEFEPESFINTNPLLVHAAVEAFRSRGAASVLIAEGPGHRRNTLDLADAAGYFKIVPKFEDSFVDLNLDDVTRVNLPRQFSRLGKVYLPNTALRAGLLVSMPKMKTHHWVGATLAMKNLFGLVPGAVYGWPKNVLHWAGITESIAALHSAFPRQFAIVDGIVGMRRRGGSGQRPGGGGRHLLPHHAHQSLPDRLFAAGHRRSGRANLRAEYPASRRSHRRGSHSVRPDFRIPVDSVRE